MDLISLLVFVGALFGGFVSGLSGFGTGLTALPIWLLSVQPVVAGPLVVICALAAQLQTLPQVWSTISWQRLTPYLLSAMLGIPVGTYLLSHVSVDVFRAAIGILLIVYSSVMFIKRQSQWVVQGNRFINPVVGFVGGILGGIAGLSGVLPTLWINLHNWDKATKRGFFQGFNLVVLSAAFVLMWWKNYITSDVLHLAAVALPGTLFGTWFGRRTYAKLNDDRFDQAILLVLLISGLLILIFWFKTLL